MDAVLTYIELQAALDRCMKAHPPAGHELQLHPDANSMSDLWAVMALEGTPSVPTASVDPRVMEAFRRWDAQSTMA